MKAQNTTQAKTPSTRPSITGGVLAIIALLSAGIAHFLTHSEGRTHTEVTTAVGTVKSGPVADAASNTVTGILSMPFSILAIVLGLIALLLTLVRLRKVKTGGMAWSLVWIFLSIWAIKVAWAAMMLLKADPA